MSNFPQDADGVIEAGVAQLPEPQSAPPEGLAPAEEQPPLSKEELQARQDAISTRRRPAGPSLEGGPLSEVQEQPSDVPETDVMPADGETA
ncbi:MAG TPA: hypothetical protein VE863_01190 [Pyrinomonadaceae bacterium]|nr:hypothetical protein [Pyrinomonadaceae bacterium]